MGKKTEPKNGAESLIPKAIMQVLTAKIPADPEKLRDMHGELLVAHVDLHDLAEDAEEALGTGCVNQLQVKQIKKAKLEALDKANVVREKRVRLAKQAEEKRIAKLAAAQLLARGS